MAGSATLSDCGRYRYTLLRPIDQRCVPLPGHPEPSGVCMFVMLNPSTADAMADDPTIRRCTDYARRWGHTRLTVVNLFAFRATRPAWLLQAEDPVGPDNDAHIATQAQTAARVVLAWGTGGAASRLLAERVPRVLALLPWPLHALALTADGQPGHPLYLSKALEPRALDAAAVRRLGGRVSGV